MADQSTSIRNDSEPVTDPKSTDHHLSHTDKISLILFGCGLAVFLVWIFSWLLYQRLKRRHEDLQRLAYVETAGGPPCESLRRHPRPWQLTSVQIMQQQQAAARNNGGSPLHPNTLRRAREETENVLPTYEARDPNPPAYTEYVNPRWGWPTPTYRQA